ncbi:hypothetical protein MNBD_GAMMA07-2574 [hydrothermal vent metagenome]|uniref:Ync n=1 Tax=hydrothermal vent metagenome TaxID=652676 RepID=A0A3B0XKT7_9ZZZZ
MLKPLRELLDCVSQFSFSNQVYFVGGTALEYHLSHRTSFDLDIATTDDCLDRANIESLIRHLRASGHEVVDVLPLFEIANFENDGLDLRDYHQDHEVDGVRLTLFTFGETEAQKNILLNDTASPYGSLNIASVDAIFKMKSLVLIDRNKSRDVFDLYYMINHCKYDATEIFKHLSDLRPNASDQIAKNRLINHKFQLTDEGYDEKDTGVTKHEVALFFRQLLVKK